MKVSKAPSHDEITIKIIKFINEERNKYRNKWRKIGTSGQVSIIGDRGEW